MRYIQLMSLFVCKVCPVCAVLPSGDPNHMTDDLAAHIALVHRLTTIDFISFVVTLLNRLHSQGCYVFVGVS